MTRSFRNIEIVCKESSYTYNMYHIAKAFFPEAEIRQSVDTGQGPLVRLTPEGGSCFSVAWEEDGILEKIPVQEKKKMAARRVYQYLSSLTGRELAWGMLTGVRPVKLAMQKIEAGMDQEEAARFLEEEYAVSREKAGLAVEIAQRERRLLGRLDTSDGFSLYVGIPFCPSICSYCSFSSSPIDAWRGRTDAYLDALCKELRAVGTMAAGKKLNTVYIGGGTPTVLEAGQLERLLSVIDETFSWEHLLEYTVEAGRPDSITGEKLDVLRFHPVTRISINPQTMQQKTLDLIGRRHTVGQVKEVFQLAREKGFDNINMDLIAGLPGEDAEDMQDTLRQIEELSPDSLTVHSLAIKRAARMGQERRLRDRQPEEAQEKGTGQTAQSEEPRTKVQSQIAQMVADGQKAAGRMGMVPYYLYRQKNIAGNFENVGYAKNGKAGIYNILIMEEKQTIIACGAGSISKRVDPDGQIERCENVKDVALYIEKIGEMIERKRRLLEES